MSINRKNIEIVRTYESFLYGMYMCFIYSNVKETSIVIANYSFNSICKYIAKKFDGYSIFECLNLHPYMNVYDQILKNPYYLKLKFI